MSAYTVTRFIPSSRYHFLCVAAPMGGRFIVARFNPEASEEERNSVLKACNSHAALVNMLARITEKVERANAVQHSGGTIEADDWAELYQLANESRAVLQVGKESA